MNKLKTPQWMIYLYGTSGIAHIFIQSKRLASCAVPACSTDNCYAVENLDFPIFGNSYERKCKECEKANKKYRYIK